MEERIRQQVYLLSAQDFADHPVWEFCSEEEDMEGQDEATVRPSSVSMLASAGPGEVVIAADVLFADGTSMPAYLYSGESNDIGCVQPNILTGTSQVNCWLGALQFRRDLKTDLASAYALIGKSPEAVFPARFQTRFALGDAPLDVVILGFMGRDHEHRVVAVG